MLGQMECRASRMRRHRLGFAAAGLAAAVCAWGQQAQAECYIFSDGRYVCRQQGSPVITGKHHDDRATRQLQPLAPNLRGYTRPLGFGSPSRKNLEVLPDMRGRRSSRGAGTSK